MFGLISKAVARMMRRNPIISKIILTALVASYLVQPLPVGAVTTTVTFDNPIPPGAPFDLLNGLFQSINFGTASWRWENAYGPNTTNHIFFDSSVGTSRTFTFSLAPKILNSMRVLRGLMARSP